MTAATHTLPGKLAGLSTPARLGVAVVAAVVAATVANTIIAAIAHGAGVSRLFRPLQFGTYTSLTVLGTLIAGLAWTAIRARSANAAALLRWLVPLVLALSFIPDILVGTGHSQAHTTWGGVIALMVMHVSVAASAVTALLILLPVSAQGTAVTTSQA
jgi:hypothetical protein